MAVMLQEWKCEVIRDVWLDLLRIWILAVVKESLLSHVVEDMQWVQKCLRQVVKMFFKSNTKMFELKHFSM